MATKAAQKRLSKEYATMQKEPPPYVWAVPDERNILTWNFIIRGPPDSPYAGGEYHGQLLFPAEYPFKPPGIKMLTPSGRFYPDKKICFSMSDFHPGSWNPAWSVQTILTGLLSFMLSDEITTGSVNSSPAHKRGFAAQSHNWNIQQARFREAFPEYATPEMRDLPNMGEKERGRADKPPTPPLAPSQSASSTAAQAPNAPGQPANGAAPANGAQPAPAPGAWGAALWEKWRWGVLIVLAVLLSRMSGQ
ncbi:UBC-like protein [Schizophyllum commune Tattone D]|nr:UBC-like protein [Schizophyllum commune Tattone D]